jgi:hypothetical protein
MRTKSGAVSWTMVLNGAFLILWIVTQIANAFGFATFQPAPEWAVIMPAIIAIVNMLLRYFRTTEPINGQAKDIEK